MIQRKSPLQHNRYKDYILKINQSSGNFQEPYTGKAFKKDSPKGKANFELTAKTYEEAEFQLKERIDSYLNEIESKQKSSKVIEPNRSVMVENPIIIIDSSEDSSDKKTQNHTSTKIEGTLKNQFADSDVILAIEKMLEKHFSLISKKIEKIEKRLDGLESNSFPVEVISKVEGLTNIFRRNQTNFEELQKVSIEKLASQEKFLQDIMNKMDVLAHSELVNEHLTQLNHQSKLLHERLDGKIDLQDAHHIFNLRNEVEQDIRVELIQSISKKIMPVVQILKGQVQGVDESTTLFKSVGDLEQRCRDAGLKSLDKLR